MALVLEDGSGVAGAVSYIDVAYFRAYWTARGVTFAEPDEELEPHLVDATDWLDGHRFHGQRATIAQRTAFPRKHCYVIHGNPRLDAGTLLPSDEVPEIVREAECEAGRANMTERLHREIDEAELLTSKGVGPLKKTFYRPDGRRRLLAVERLIAGLHHDGRRGPSTLILRS